MENKEVKEDKKFYEQVDGIFKNSLDYYEKEILYIKDKNKDEVLKILPYHKVFFDNNLNIYKLDNNNVPVFVADKNFETVVEKKKIFLEKQNLPF